MNPIYQKKTLEYLSTLTPKLTLSTSQINTWQRCRQMWYWIYVEDQVPKSVSDPLIVGSITHVLRELWVRDIHQGTPQKNFNEKVIINLPLSIQQQYNATEEQARFCASESIRLMRAYISEFAEDREFAICHPELQLEKDYGPFILYARLDGLAVDQDGRQYRNELKTTSRMDSQYLAGYRRGLQTGICHMLMQDLLPEKTYGTLFEILAKTKIAQAKRQSVLLDRWQVEYSRLTVQNEAQQIFEGHIYPSMQCHMYNKMCEYQPLCQASLTKAGISRAKAFYNSRKEEFARTSKMQLLGVPLTDKDGFMIGS